jgi:hypothetical protein
VGVYNIENGAGQVMKVAFVEPVVGGLPSLLFD